MIFISQVYDEDDVFARDSTLGESQSPPELNTGTTASSVSDQESLSSGMYLNIDRGEEMSKSTETIVPNGEFNSADDFLNTDSARSDELNYVRLVNGASVDSSCDDGQRDSQDECKDAEIVRQRPSIVINHCESIDQNGDVVEKTENIGDFKCKVKKNREREIVNNNEIVSKTDDLSVTGGAIKETNDSINFSPESEASSKSTTDSNSDTIPANASSASIEETNVNSSPSTSQSSHYIESNSLEQNTIVHAITRIDDNQNIMSSKPEEAVEDSSVGHKMVPVSSMADLVFNLIVDKPDIASEGNVLSESTDNSKMELNESSKNDSTKTETIDLETIQSTEHGNEPIKSIEPCERTESLDSADPISRAHYLEQTDSSESFDRNDLVGKAYDIQVNDMTNIHLDEDYTNYETTPDLLEKVVVIARDMRCIDEKDAVMMERVRRQQSEEALKQLANGSSLAKNRQSKQNSQSNGTNEKAAIRNNERIDEDSDMNNDNFDTKEIETTTNESKSGILFPFKVNSIADFVYNMIVDRPNETEKTSEEVKNGNVEDSLSERSKVLLDASNDSETTSQSNSVDVEEISNGSNVKNSNHPKILLTKDSIELELGSQATSLEIEKASSQNSSNLEITNQNSSNFEVTNQNSSNLEANNQINSNLEANNQNLNLTSPLIFQLKRTNSALSLREELLESIGSIDHEKSPDLDDLLSSIGPVSTHNQDYDDEEIYESDFDENVEILGHRERKTHHCRRKHDNGRENSNTPEGSESETFECEHRVRTVRRNIVNDINANETNDSEEEEEFPSHATICDCHSSSLSYNQRRQHYYPSETSPEDTSSCCHGIDVDMLDALDESCHIPMIKSIDKIISTLENVLEPLEQITDSATESEISCSYKRRAGSGVVRAHHAENLNMLIAKLNHINANHGKLFFLLLKKIQKIFVFFANRWGFFLIKKKKTPISIPYNLVNRISAQKRGKRPVPGKV